MQGVPGLVLGGASGLVELATVLPKQGTEAGAWYLWD